MSILARLWNALRPERLDEEVRLELETHVALLEEEARSHGMSAREARAHARRRFGNPAAYREETRGSDVSAWLDALRMDVGFGWRQLRRSPGFTACAVALLALGIGLNAAIFTLVNGVILRPLPLPEPERLVVILERLPGGGTSPPSWPDQRDLRDQHRAFQSLGAFAYGGSFILRLGDGSQRLPGGYVTPDYFSTLGVRPVAGRLFAAAEGEPGRDNVVLVREDFWRRALGGAPDILRRTLTVNGRECTVVGILPGWFGFPAAQSVVWAPLVPTPEQRARGWHGFPMVGRLRPGVTRRQAQADVDAIVRRLGRTYPDADRDRGGLVFDLRSWNVGDDAQHRLLVLQAAALALYLMACANVSSLLLARHAARRREFAIRNAVGASRARRVRQHLTESLLLTALGCVAAAGVAWSGVRLLVWLFDDRMPQTAAAAPGWRLIGVTTLIALGGAVVIGLTTALHEDAHELEAALRETHRSTGGRRTVVMRRSLVVFQVACAVALLGGAGELIQSFWALLHVDTGIDPRGLLTLRVDMPQARYRSGREIARFYDGAVARLRAVPGVASAAAINLLPVEQAGFNGDLEARGLPPPPSGFYAEYRWVAGDYFSTMGIPILRGRPFLAAEMSGGRKAAIVNETLARALWGDQDPLGRELRAPNSDETPAIAAWLPVVGIARDVRQSGLEVPPRPEVYFPAAQFEAPFTSWTLAVRSPLPPAGLLPALRRALRAADPDAVAFRVRTMDELIAERVSYQRIVAVLLSCFAALALALSALGIHGVVSYVVSARVPEFAIRAALGAAPATLVRLASGQGLSLIAIGLVLGTAAVVPLNSLLAGLLFGVQRLPAWLFAGALLVLIVPAVLAALLPALRTARIDPVRVLRQE
jgi:putative ABC transport system permease protein